MPKRRSDEFNRSEFSLATTSRKEAIKRNEYFRQEGIAAHHEIKPDGQISPLVFRTMKGEIEACKALSVPGSEIVIRH